MESCPIISWQIKGEKLVIVIGFIFLGSKTTADSDCSQKFKRHLLFGKKVMRNLESILKSRDVILLTKFLMFKAMVFSSSQVWM